MSQGVFDSIDPDIVGGTELAGILDNFKDALMSGLKGPTRPTQTQAGGGWIDDSTAGLLRFKIYTGSTDITVFTLNTTTNTASFTGSDDFFEVTRVSADAVGPYLSFKKSRAGGVLSGDVLGEIQFKGLASDSNTYTVGRVRYVASQNMTGVAQGGYFVFEGTRNNQAAMVEFARFVEGRLAIGNQSPTHAIHVTSTTGIKNERVSEDATGAKRIQRKARTLSSGQVKNGDEISTDDFNSTDVAGTEFTGARVTVTADEDHTATNRGTKVAVQSIPKGTNTLVEAYNIAEGKQTMGIPLSIAGLEKQVQLFPSVSEVLALQADAAFIEVTGTTPMTIKGILSTSKSKSFYLYNATNQNIVIANQAADAAADNRIAVNGETSMTLQPGKSVEFVRRNTISRWSPLVEGNTGITYNEAVDLTAKMIAKTWFSEVLQNVYSATPPAATALPAPTGIAANPELMLAIGRGTGGLVCASTSSKDSGNWVSTGNSNADYATTASEDTWWKKIAAAGLDTITARFVSVRASGTIRVISGLYSSITGGVSPSTIPGADHTAAWRDIATDGTNFVAVSSSGANRVMKIPFAGGITYVPATTIDVPLRSVAYGAGIYVAVGGVVPGGSPNHSAWVSSDGGSTWTSYALPNEATVEYSLVRYLNNQFVAIGGTSAAGMVVLTSPDGQTWTSRFTAPIGMTLKDMAYGGGLNIIVTDLAKAVISTDGINFVSVDSVAMQAVLWNGERFIGSRITQVYPSILKSISPAFI